MKNDAKKRCGGQTVICDEFCFYRALNAKGWTQRDLAAVSGISPLICSHMANSRPVYKRHFYRACTALGVEPEQLLNRSAAAAPAEPPSGYMLVKQARSESVTILLSPWMKSEIKKAAKEQKLSMSELINRMIEDYFDKEGK